MAEARLLIDTDNFVLLSAAGLLEKTAAVLGIGVKNLRRLDPVPHQLRKSRKFRTYPETIRNLAIEAAKTIASITEQPKDTDTFTLLAAVEDVDDGETLLFSLLAEEKSWLLTTGDKRCLRAIAKAPELEPVRQVVAQRVICLETLIGLLIEAYGIEGIAKAFTSVRDCNVTLSVLFSSGEATTAEHCLAGIESHLRNLESDIGPGFLYKPAS